MTQALINADTVIDAAMSSNPFFFIFCLWMDFNP